MHIHGVSNQFAPLIPTQYAQQAMATRRAAAEVRRKLANPANADCAGPISSSEESAQRGRRHNQPDDEQAFRKVFLSVQA